MKRTIFIFLLALYALPGNRNIQACTTGLAHSGFTSNGHALLWKNRDSGFKDNEVAFFRNANFSFIGIINADDTTQIWAGVNNYGFAIMNAESRDMAVPDENTQYDDEGYLMKEALNKCKTIDDFETMLKASNATGRKVTSNFGVIDATGNAAFFETGNHEYFRFDTYSTSGKEKFLVRANFAQRARSGKGYGQIRYGRAVNLLRNALENGNLNYKHILSVVSKDIHLPDSILAADNTSVDKRKTRDTVNRFKTVSCAVFDGVGNGEDPRFTTFWCTLGEPVVSISVPLWVFAGNVPTQMVSASGSPLNKTFQKIKRQLYPEDACIDLNQVNRIQHILYKGQKKIFRKTENILKEWRRHNPAPEEVSRFQDQMAAIAVQTAQKVITMLEKK
ncbi:hypothetical protein KJ656_00505 [bacterium]|nr:hypothetical protein [bacterium]